MDDFVRNLATIAGNLFAAWLAAGIWAASCPSHAEEVLLFPYFDANGQNGIYLCWSRDGETFEAVNGGKPIFTPPTWPGQSLTRDPSIIQQGGKFHMVWTSNWSGNIFGYATSENLVDWSEPQQIQPFPDGVEQPKNVWAPEIFYDHVAKNFKVVWSSTLESERDDGDDSADRHGNDHRMYYIATGDFEEFSAPELLLADQGYSVIDAHLVYDDRQNEDPEDDRWVMSFKKEVEVDRGGKNIRLAFGPPEIAPSSFDHPTDPVAGPGSDVRPREQGEGPSIVRWQGKWLLYWDAFGSGHYCLATSSDLQQWKDQTDRLSLPTRHPRHGSVFAADADAIGWDLE